MKERTLVDPLNLELAAQELFLAFSVIVAMTETKEAAVAVVRVHNHLSVETWQDVLIVALWRFCSWQWE